APPLCWGGSDARAAFSVPAPSTPSQGPRPDSSGTREARATVPRRVPARCRAPARPCRSPPPRVERHLRDGAQRRPPHPVDGQPVPGAIEGATGRSSVVDPVLEVFSATASGPGPGWWLGTTPMRASLPLEEHGRGRVLVDAHPANHPLEQAFELLPLAGAELLQRIDELCLRRARCSGEEALARGG